MIGALAVLAGAIALSRRRGRRRGLGTIPPMPTAPIPWRTWVERTFAAGTPVMVVAPSGAPSDTTDVLLDPQGVGYDEYIQIHNGMRGVTNGEVMTWNGAVGLMVIDDRDKWGTRTSAIGKVVYVPVRLLKPLADNWTAPQTPKSTPIPQRGWARQASASRGMRSRR